MKQLVCEMCGGTDLVKIDGFFVCQACGIKYSLEEAKKMTIEGTVDVQGTVTVDDSNELANLYQIARRARDDNNSENAEKYYSQIIIKDPASWEANFYTVYFQTMCCKIGGIRDAAIKLRNCEDSVVQLIKDNVSDGEERRKAVDEIKDRLISISQMLFNAARNHYLRFTNASAYECIYHCCAASDVLYNYGDCLIKYFGDLYGKEIAVPCWKVGIEEYEQLIRLMRANVFAKKEIDKNIVESYGDKIKEYDPDYQAPEVNKSKGCYVATCVYGSYDCPQVWTLRRYRDDTLGATWYGRAFIRVYYAISPTLVKWFGKTKWFKKMWKGKLDRMVKKLQDKGVENTPYEDKDWGK